MTETDKLADPRGLLAFIRPFARKDFPAKDFAEACVAERIAEPRRANEDDATFYWRAREAFFERLGERWNATKTGGDLNRTVETVVELVWLERRADNAGNEGWADRLRVFKEKVDAELYRLLDNRAE